MYHIPAGITIRKVRQQKKANSGKTVGHDSPKNSFTFLLSRRTRSRLPDDRWWSDSVALLKAASWSRGPVPSLPALFQNSNKPWSNVYRRVHVLCVHIAGTSSVCTLAEF